MIGAPDTHPRHPMICAIYARKSADGAEGDSR